MRSTRSILQLPGACPRVACAILLALACASNGGAASAGVVVKWTLPVSRGAIPVTGPDGDLYIYGGATPRVTRLDPVTGATRWSFHVGGLSQVGAAISGVRSTGGSAKKVLIWTTTESLYALDPETGEVAWEFAPAAGSSGWQVDGMSEAGRLVYGFSSAPPAPSSPARIYGLEPETAAVVWTLDLPRVSFAPTLTLGSSARAYFAVYDLTASYTWPIYCVDGLAGGINWKINLPTNEGSVSRVVVDAQERLFVTTGDGGHLYSLDGKTGATRWHVGTGSAHPRLTAPELDNHGSVFVFDGSNGKVSSFDTGSGSNKWTFDTGTKDSAYLPLTASPYGSVLVTLYWTINNGQSSTGMVYALNATTGGVKWTLPLPGGAQSSAVSAPDGSIYVADALAGQLIALAEGQVTHATATAVAQTVNGFLVSASIASPGAGYTNPPVVTVIGGGGTGALVTAQISDGAVVSLDVQSAGRGYKTLPTILIAPPVPSPSPAKAVATLAGDVLSGIVVTDGGYGYGTGAVPAVRIVGGGGTGATAVAIVQGGVVVGINLVSGGSGYTSPPTVQLGAPQALASTSIEVSSVDVRLHMTPGFIYQLQTSPDAQSWSDVGIPFLAVEASALQTFQTRQVHQFFRLVEVP